MAANVIKQNPSIVAAMGMKSYEFTPYHDPLADLSYINGVRKDIENLKRSIQIGDIIKVARGYVLNRRKAERTVVYIKCRVAEKYRDTVLLEYHTKSGIARLSPSYRQLYFMINGDVGEIDG